MAVHFLKVLPKFMGPLISGAKNFEIRKNDRGFAKDDILVLEEFDVENELYTGRALAFKVPYILNHTDFPSGIPQGHCVMSIYPHQLTPQLRQLLAKKGMSTTH